MATTTAAAAATTPATSAPTTLHRDADDETLSQFLLFLLFAIASALIAVGVSKFAIHCCKCCDRKLPPDPDPSQHNSCVRVVSAASRANRKPSATTSDKRELLAPSLFTIVQMATPALSRSNGDKSAAAVTPLPTTTTSPPSLVIENEGATATMDDDVVAVDESVT